MFYDDKFVRSISYILYHFASFNIVLVHPFFFHYYAVCKVALAIKTSGVRLIDPLTIGPVLWLFDRNFKCYFGLIWENILNN